VTLLKLTVSRRCIQGNSAPTRSTELRVSRKGLRANLDAHFKTIGWGPSRATRGEAVQCPYNPGGLYTDTMLHRAVASKESLVWKATIKDSKLHVRSGKGDNRPCALRMPSPSTRTPSRGERGRKEVERSILYPWGLEPQDRPTDWTASRWAAGEMEGGHPGGESSSKLLTQDWEIPQPCKSNFVKGQLELNKDREEHGE
jgi:hypothetical protein